MSRCLKGKPFRRAFETVQEWGILKSGLTRPPRASVELAAVDAIPVDPPKAD